MGKNKMKDLVLLLMAAIETPDDLTEQNVEDLLARAHKATDSYAHDDMGVGLVPVYRVESRAPDGTGTLGYFSDFKNAMCFARAWADRKVADDFRDEVWGTDEFNMSTCKAGYAMFVDDFGFVCAVNEADGMEYLFEED